MTENQTDADQVIREMQQVRTDLQGDVQQLQGDVRQFVAQARTLTDWRHYVRSYPWACLGAAAAIGYLAVPARRTVMQLDASGVRELAAQQKLEVRVTGHDKPKKSGLLAIVAGMAARSLMNGGLALISQQFSQLRGSPADLERTHRDD